MPVDFSPLTAPIPESPSSQGLKYFGDALDAVMQRRHQMEMAKQQQEATLANQKILDDRQREQMGLVYKAAELGTNQRREAAGVTAGQKSFALGTQLDSAITTLETQANALENTNAPGWEDANDRLQEMKRQRRAMRVAGGQPSIAPASPGPVVTPEAAAPAPPVAAPPATAMPPPVAAPSPSPGPPTPAPQPDFMGSLAAAMNGAGEAAPPAAPLESVEPPPVEAPPMLPVADPAMAATPRPIAWVDQWEQQQLGEDPLPSVGAIIRAQAISLRQRGRSYLSEAENKINAERTRIQSGLNSELSARSREVIRPGDAARLEEMQLQHFKEDVEKLKRESGYNTARETLRAMDRADQEIRSGIPISETGARFSIGKAIAGAGVFTDQEQRSILREVGGKVASWKQTVQTWVDGKLLPQQRQIFERYIALKRDTIRQFEAKQSARSYRQSIMAEGSTGFDQFRPQAINIYNRLYTPFGLMPLGPDGEEVKVEGAQSSAPGKAPRRGASARPTAAPVVAPSGEPKTEDDALLDLIVPAKAARK